MSQKAYEKKRQIQKFNDISSASLSTSYSLTPGQSTNKENERNSTPDTPNQAISTGSTQDQMINSTSTVTTESSSPVLSSRSSTSSSASNSPSSSQETKEQTLNDENSIHDELLSSSSTSSLHNNNDINKTPVSTKTKRLSTNELEQNEN